MPVDTTRTTITMTIDGLARAKEVAMSTKRTLGSVLEDALEEQLARHAEAGDDASPARLPSHEMGVFLVDVLDRDALADALRERPA